MFPLKLVKAVEKVIYVYFKTNTEHINRLCGRAEWRVFGPWNKWNLQSGPVRDMFGFCAKIIWGNLSTHNHELTNHTEHNTHTNTYTRTHTYTHIHLHIHTHIHIHTHTQKYTHTKIHTQTHTYTHKYTHTHIHTHTNTNKHIIDLKLLWGPMERRTFPQLTPTLYVLNTVANVLETLGNLDICNK